MEELLSLKWNNHRSTFIQILGTLREKQSYTDVTLACDGKFYSVHKLVLSTCSEYFSAMFDKTPCKNPVIVLKDIKSDDLDALLDYMYLGEVNVRQSDLASLIKAAECLRIKGLAVPDDEPPKKGPSTSRVGSSNAPERRADSPPAKRKRRDGSEDSRDDSRHSMAIAPQPPQAQSPPPSSSRPKTPPGGTQRHSPAPHPPRPSQSSPSEGGRAPSPSHPPTASPAERTTPQSRGGEGEQYDQPTPYVKVEMDDGGQGDPLGDSYDIPSDGYKEESDVGGDLSNDFPEFLQAAASGTLPGNSTSPSFSHPNFPGTSAFQPGEIPGWQGDGTIGLPPHLTFSTSENSSQNPGDSVRWDDSLQSLASGAVGTMNAGNGAGADGINDNNCEGHGGGGGGGGGGSGSGGGGSGGNSSSGSGVNLWCSVCGHTFSRPWLLARHMRTHTGERPFPCPQCPYRATRREYLRLHLFKKHERLDVMGPP